MPIFKSKAGAFREAVAAGMQEYRLAIENLQRSLGDGWRRHLIDFYMSERRTCDLADSCALQSLTSEVARSDDDVKETFEAELRAMIAAAAAGMPADSDADRRADAAALLALLAGGVSLARAVKDPALAEEIAEAVRRAAVRLAG
jgi:AcrR family transcriptional regulator